MAKRRTTFLTLGEKYELLKDHKTTDLSKADFARQYNISVPTLKDILAKEDIIRQRIMNNEPENNKRHNVAMDSVEAELVIWMNQASSDEQRSYTLIKQEALRIARRIGYFEFKASSGWISRFKKKYGFPTRNSWYGGDRRSAVPSTENSLSADGTPTPDFIEDGAPYETGDSDGYVSSQGCDETEVEDLRHENDEKLQPCTRKEALLAFSILENHLLSCPDCTDEVCASLATIERHLNGVE